MLLPGAYWITMVQVAFAANVVPFVQVVPVARIENLPPPFVVFATVGAAANVIDAALVLVTVMVPEWVVVDAGVGARVGVTVEKLTVGAACPVPLRFTGEFVTGTLALMVTVPVCAPVAVAV